jgi:DNA-binding transcriptional regulator YbjK
MDRKILIEVVDELITEQANGEEPDVDLAVSYSRHYHPNAVEDGREEWKDCLEALTEAVAQTIAGNVADGDLSEMAAERVADVLLDRVRELTRGSPLRSSEYSHIPGVMNLH